MMIIMPSPACLSHAGDPQAHKELVVGRVAEGLPEAQAADSVALSVPFDPAPFSLTL